MTRMTRMTKDKNKDERLSAVLARVDQQLKSGEVDRRFDSFERTTQDTITKLHRADELDPQTLKLTVTI